MPKPLVSIIVPVYNVENYLKQCLDSVINQTYKDIEIILIDDGSTDNSGKICEEYAKKDARIKFFRQENKGLSAVKNRGIETASGDYIMFIDSDDYPDAQMCEKLLNALSEQDADMAVCHYSYIDDGGNLLPSSDFGGYRPFPDSVLTSKEYIESICQYGSMVCVVSWNKMYKKAIFKNLRFAEGKLAEDELIIHHIADACSKISIISGKYYYYRIRKGSITNTEHLVKRLDNTNALLDRLKFIKERNYDAEFILGLEKEIINDFIRSIRMLDKNDKEHRAEVKRFNKTLKPIVKHLLANGNLTKSEKTIFRIFRINPLIFLYWK